MDSRIQEYLLNIVSICLNTAGQYNGRVFGEYVRDVIVPNSINPNCSVNIRNVDLWFQNHTEAINYVNQLNNVFIPVSSDDYDNIKRKRFLLIHSEIYFNIYISEHLPPQLVNVHQLTYICN